jgi:DNA-binding transcriptional LysR family regulator
VRAQPCFQIKRPRDARAVFGIGIEEVLDLTALNLLWNVLHVPGDVLDQPFARIRSEDPVQQAGLLEIIRSICPRIFRSSRSSLQRDRSFNMLRHMVASGLGYTLMPLLAMREDAKFKRLIRYRAFSGKPVGRSIVLVCRRSDPRIRDIELLAGFLREERPKGTIRVTSSG